MLPTRALTWRHTILLPARRLLMHRGAGTSAPWRRYICTVAQVHLHRGAGTSAPVENAAVRQRAPVAPPSVHSVAAAFLMGTAAHSLILVLWLEAVTNI